MGTAACHGQRTGGRSLVPTLGKVPRTLINFRNNSLLIEDINQKSLKNNNKAPYDFLQHPLCFSNGHKLYSHSTILQLRSKMHFNLNVSTNFL